jgi:mitogen-activated protein kinase kinase kinase 1
MRPKFRPLCKSDYGANFAQIACAGEPPDVPGHLSPGLRDLSLRCLELEPCLRPSARDLLLHPVLQAGRPAEKIALI